MKKQSDSTSFTVEGLKEHLRLEAEKYIKQADNAETPKKRGRPAKGTTTPKEVATKAVWAMLKNGKWVATGGKGSAHFTKLKEAGIVLRCDSPKGYTTIWNVKTGVKL
tara:strand:- start:182 stop:505 length:324 start_codon:yes stop_codon:yes gene_type:complete